MDIYHQQTPSFDNKGSDFKFSLTPNNTNNFNTSSSKLPLFLNDPPSPKSSNNLKDSQDICCTADPKNNDYSPAISENNRNVETFQQKYLIDKIKLENPLNDDYFKKKKSVSEYNSGLFLREEDIKLRLSYGQKGLDDFEVNYDKEGFVPMFNFNSNKSQISKKENLPMTFKNNNAVIFNYFWVVFACFFRSAINLNRKSWIMISWRWGPIPMRRKVQIMNLRKARK